MADRDQAGRLLPGHNLNQVRKLNLAINQGGAPKTIIGEVRDALSIAADAMPEIIQVMITRARNPNDRDCQRAGEYLADRIYGKPNQPLSGNLRQQIIREVIKLPSDWPMNSGSTTPGDTQNPTDYQSEALEEGIKVLV